LENAARTVETEPHPAPDESPIDAEAVRAHVARVLKTPDFASAPQLSVFLKYVVERQLAGAGASLKAYTIATEALGRDSNFDPQTDPIVRVQARRLRQSLLLYYADKGAAEPMRIIMPVGGYAPEFVDMAKAAAKPAAAEPAFTPAKPKDDRLFPTPWVAPTALILSLIAIIGNIMNMWPGLLPLILSKFR
jgi:hypothetical protein